MAVYPLCHSTLSPPTTSLFHFRYFLLCAFFRLGGGDTAKSEPSTLTGLLLYYCCVVPF